MCFKKNVSFYLFFLCCVVFTFSQTNGNNQTDLIANRINELSKRKAEDLIYIQTNKDIYMSQEDLWFKGYVLDAQFHVPSLRSNLFYLQLLNDKTEEVVWEEKYEIEHGFVDGHVYLDEKLESGNYTLVAYTSYSFFKNTEEFCAQKKIKIFSVNKEELVKDESKEVNSSKIKFSVFPEGGHLVAGFENKLAFKATDLMGYPENVTGYVYENDSIINTFNTSHLGMGTFKCFLKTENKYQIKVNDTWYEFPEVLKEGKLLHLISQTPKYANFKIARTTEQIGEKVFVRLHVRGVTYKILIKTLESKESLIKIPLTDVPNGVAEVTLFNSSLKPIAERLIYIGLDKNLKIETNLSKERYKTREKVVLKLSIKDANDQPVVTHLGLSVYDKFYRNKVESKNILTHYYLSSQLKGNIYNPEYYFDKNNKTRKRDLDLLLLTNGWRSYQWSESNLEKLQPKTNAIIEDPLIGKFKVLYKEKEPKPYFVVVSSGNQTNNTNFIQVNEDKSFKVSSRFLKIGQRGYVYLKPFGEGDTKDYRILVSEVDSDTITKYKKQKQLVYSFKSAPKSLFKEVTPFQYYDGTQNLEEVYIKKRKTPIFRDKLLGQLDSLQKLEPNIETCVCHNGIVNCKNHCPSFGFVSNNVFDGHKKQLTQEELLELYNLTAIKSFYGKRQFFNMTYDEVTVNDPFPDKRNTLLWAPNLVTDQNGEVIVEFYCSDTNSEFLGVIEAVGADGGLGHEAFRIRVNKHN
ncbi:hypothetical protein [Seonamhaeicola marinus]|uniref:Macroglobulin domain-containing protein n=1 Tax=Seonamhaeicola marinus TaxID=1912246 RepID=A0A5D0HF20_9FLAO|nr:hypothetical protein [Seonamhaeicola marinus]TYA69886.1 hypothetical protein FUA24_21575 [Seonamhaeicola marinus]